MNRRFRPRAGALLFLALAACAAPPRAAAPAAGTTTVVVVRHAERASTTDRDSPLSPAGEARALALADALADAGVDAIYTSQYRRTRDTARPLADRLGLELRVDSVGDAESSSRALAAHVRAEHAGETVLVVGHGNTVPMIVRALGGADVGTLESGDYDRLFVVVIPPSGAAATVRTRYGAPT